MTGYSRRRIARLLGLTTGSVALGRVASAAALTPGQVEGPFHPVSGAPDWDLDLVSAAAGAPAAAGEPIIVSGTIADTTGTPLAGALLDIWQANHHGRYRHPRDPNPAPLDPHFRGWGMLRTDAQGRYTFKTILPGTYPLGPLGGTGWRCRHIHFKVSHGDAQALTTQMYFAGDPLIEQDQEIAKVPIEQRPRLIANAEPDATTGLPRYGFDIVLAQASA